MIALKISWLVLVSVGAVVLSRVMMGEDGSTGACVGLGIGAVLCLVNFFITRRVRKATEPNFKLIMVGVIVSFWLLIVSVLLVNYLAAPLVKPASLTALALYLAYRGAEVVEFSRPSGIVAGPSLRCLRNAAYSTTADAESAKEGR